MDWADSRRSAAPKPWRRKRPPSANCKLHGGGCEVAASSSTSAHARTAGEELACERRALPSPRRPVLAIFRFPTTKSPPFCVPPVAGLAGPDSLSAIPDFPLPHRRVCFARRVQRSFPGKRERKREGVVEKKRKENRRGARGMVLAVAHPCGRKEKNRKRFSLR